MILTPDLLLSAYRQGFFPMAHEGAKKNHKQSHKQEILWYQPERRGLLPLAHFHIPKRLRPLLNKDDYTITLNHDFLSVITACATASITGTRQGKTWINDEIINAYHNLHSLGFAHSLEVYDPVQQELVGGIYGVTLGAAFFGESMFSRKTNASKIALTYLAAHLLKQGFMLFDTQYLTPHLARFGGFECLHDDYIALLEEALRHPRDFITKPQSSGISSSALCASEDAGLSDKGLSSAVFSLSKDVLSPLLHSKTHTS